MEVRHLSQSGRYSALGGGEYEYLGRGSRNAARKLFLRAVQECEPHVLESLRDGPFRIFRGVHPREPAAPVPNARPKTLKQWLKQWPFCLEPEVVAESLHEWLGQWQLPRPPADDWWCWWQALQAMTMWRNRSGLAGGKWAPQPADGLTGSASGDGVGLHFSRILPDFPDLDLTFSLDATAPDSAVAVAQWNPGIGRFILRAWNPEEEQFVEARQRIHKAFEQLLDHHMHAIRNSLEASAWGRTRRKREGPHFEWLARYQVQEWSYEDIRREYDLRERKTAEEGVKNAAALVGLKLRAAKRGRPVGVKEREGSRNLSEAGILSQRKKRSSTI